MVSAAKAFLKEPPKRPLDNLEAIVEDFQWRYVDRKKTDQVVVYCADSPNLAVAVRRAVEARDEFGKHHNHQSKVDITARRKFGRKIIYYAARKALPLTDFDALHDKLDEIKPYGIGPVTVYDVAVRIGAYTGAEPQSVYMHAGVRQGARALWEAMWRTKWFKADKQPGAWSWRDDRIPVDLMPKPLNKMRADDVEDILCTYREVFETW